MRQPYPLTYHKAGDTWDRTQRYTLPAGTWTATSTARTADGTLVQTFACALTTLVEDPDGYTHALNTTATATDTADWPLATLLADVVFTDASATPVKRSSSAFQIASCAYLPEVLDDYTNLAVIPGDLLALVRGEDGPPGEGMPAGGTAGQVLAKASNTNYDLAWVDQTGGGGAGATNLAYTSSPTGGTVTSDTGTDAALPLADGTNAGLMAPAQHSKLAGIAAGATAVTVDAAPTDGSSNAVSSNGVFDALAGKSDTGHNHSGVYDPAGTAASAVSAHAGATDPHGDRAWASGQFAATGHNHSGTYDPAGTASSALSAHTGAADPHTQYALESALGTAAVLNVPAAGNAASGEVVKGSDSRLTDARTPTAHNQSASTISDSTTVGRAVLTAIDAAAARSAIGAGTSSFDGAYASLSGKPTLGDAAAKNTGTTAGTVAAGDDSRLSDERVPTAAGLAAKTTGATSKATPVDADEIPAADSAASFGLKKLTWANIKATLKTYFDTLYQAVLVSGTNIKTINSASILGSGNITVSASPAGSSGQLQWNSSGSLAGVSGSVVDANGRINLASSGSAGVFACWNSNQYIGIVAQPTGHTNLAGLFNVGTGPIYVYDTDTGDTIVNVSYSGGKMRLAVKSDNTVYIDNGTAGTLRDLKLRNLIGTGNLATGAVSKTADYTATTSDGTIEVDASGAARTITLFAASGNAGKIVVIKKTDSSGNAVTVDGNASETIDGATTISLASQYSTAILQVNAAGTGWNKLGGV